MKIPDIGVTSKRIDGKNADKDSESTVKTQVKNTGRPPIYKYI